MELPESRCVCVAFYIMILAVSQTVWFLWHDDCELERVWKEEVVA